MYKSVTSVAAAALVVASTALLAQAPERPPRPGVKTPGVKIPIERLKPDAVFTVGGRPDWLAIDEAAWVSNYPDDNVARFDPKTNTVAAKIPLGAGKRPCSGLAEHSRGCVRCMLTPGPSKRCGPSAWLTTG